MFVKQYNMMDMSIMTVQDEMIQVSGLQLWSNAIHSTCWCL